VSEESAWGAWSDRDLVDELCDIDRGLSDWEMDFADSLAKIDGRWPLSTGQRSKAIEILANRGVKP